MAVQEINKQADLKKILIDRENLLQEYGKYEKDLSLKEKDPIQYELYYTKMTQVLFNAHEVAKLVSASPVVRELGEIIFGLYTAEGDAICLSHGLLVHVHTISETIKWMIKNDYETKVGFKKGDIFFNNDPYIGGAHCLDQMIIIPIVYEGEVVGWAAGLTHVPETGAVEPGGYGAWFRSRFYEGLFLPCVRVGEEDHFSHDIEIMVDRSTRTSTWWHTDNRAKFTGSRIVRDEVLKIIEEIGLDTYKKLTHEYIEDSFQATKKRIKQVLKPGTYREVGWRGSVIPGEERLLHAPVEMTVNEDGTIRLNLEGLSPALWQPFQGTLSVTQGLIMNGLIQYLLYDLKHNEGNLLAVDMHVPLGTACNPDNILYPTTLWGPAYAVGVATGQLVSRAYYAKGYFEEVHASSALSTGYTAGGKDQYGRQLGAHNMEFGAAGMYALAVMDGLDTSGVEFNPEGDMGDSEIWEQIMPPIYLAREIRIDGGGFGKYRGGNGIQSWYAVNSNEIEIGGFGSAPIFPSPGLMGGYPAAALNMWVGRNTKLKQHIEEGKTLPSGENSDTRHAFMETLGGDWEVKVGSNFPATKLKSHDMFSAVTGDGGGFGDPTERNPESVAHDVRNGWTSARAAKSIYCVMLDDNGEVDLEGTEKLRQERRQERLKQGVPASEYKDQLRSKVENGELPAPVRRMYSDVFSISKPFLERFRSFWNLSEDWTLSEE